MSIKDTAVDIAKQRAVSGILKPITAKEVSDYCPNANKEQVERIAFGYNETWARRSWDIRNGELVYAKR